MVEQIGLLISKIYYFNTTMGMYGQVKMFDT